MSSISRRKILLSGSAMGAALLAGCGTDTPPPVTGPTTPPVGPTDPTGPTDPPVIPVDPVTPPVSSRVFLRENVYSLSNNMQTVESYRRGVAVMKTRDVNDPTSWMYQANMHGTFSSVPSGTLWNMCRHGSGQFLPWHRMYLYYFERMIRDASGDPNFALPFWDYSAPGQAALPPGFRAPTNSSNALFNPNRNGSVNAGSTLPFSTFTVANSMTFDQFIPSGLSPGFGSGDSGGGSSGQLEFQPHNVIHVAIGGDMGHPATAGQDPIFWLHHCNIDRLWAVWLSLGGNRADPLGDSAWMNQSFNFFDENGSRVSMTNRDILDTMTLGSEGYEYDSFGFQTPGVGSPPAPGPKTGVSTAETGAISFGADLRKSVDMGPSIGMQSAAGVNDNLTAAKHAVLVLEQAKATGAVGVYYEIYLNLPAGTAPDPKSIYYVGVLDFFSAQGASGHGHGSGDVFTKRYEIGRMLKKQNAAGVFTDLSKAPNLTFVASGMPQTVGGALQVNTQAGAGIGSARIEVVR